MQRKSFSSVVAATIALVLCTVTLSDALNVKLSGVNYDLRRAADWDPKRCKSSTLIDSDMKLLNTITNRVRIYTTSDCNVRQVLKSAKQLNMTVWMGLWVDKKVSVFNKELAEFQDLITEKLISTDVVAGINIGSEVLYRNDAPASRLIENYNSVKEVLKKKGLEDIKLSITDTLGKLIENPAIVDLMDIVTFNQFPFWNNISIDGAIADLKASVETLTNTTKSKPFVIAETGWAAGGFDERAAKASPESAARYMKEFYLLAEEKGWKYYYFVAFDAPFLKKSDTSDNSVEAYFGLFSTTNKLNAHYANLTIPATKAVDGEVGSPETKAPTTTKPPASASDSSLIVSGSVLLVAISAWFV